MDDVVSTCKRKESNRKTAFRTISMRIRGLDEETEEALEDFDLLQGKLADLTKTAKHPGGISLFTDETKTEYKSTYQLLKDISGIWDELTDKQQAGVLETIAGKRGGQVLAGVLEPENFKEVERALQEMQNAAGSADQEMSIIEESIDYKLNRLKETWVGFVQDLIDRGTLGELVDNLTRISEIIIEIVDNLGPLGTFLGGLSAYLAVKNKDDIFSGFSNFIEGGMIEKAATDAAVASASYVELGTSGTYAATGLTETAAAAGAAGAAEGGAVVKTFSLKAALDSMAASMGITVGAMGAIAGVVGVFGAVAFAAYEANKANNELRKSAKELGKSFVETQGNLSDYKDKVVELQGKLKEENLSYEESREIRQQLLSIQDELLEKYGNETSAINAITSAIDGEVDAFGRLSEIQWQQTKNEFNNQNLKGWDWLNRATHGVDNNIDLMKKEMEGVEVSLLVNAEDREFIERIAELYDGASFGWNDELNTGSLTLSGNLENIQAQLLQIQTTASSLGKELTFNDQLTKTINDNQEVIDAYKNKSVCPL